jgi:hypothetical protein
MSSMLSNKCRTFKCLPQNGDNGIFKYLYLLRSFLHCVDKKIDILNGRQEGRQPHKVVSFSRQCGHPASHITVVQSYMGGLDLGRACGESALRAETNRD